MKTEILKDILALLMPSVDNKGIVKEFMYLSFQADHVEATDGSMLVKVELPENTESFCVEARVFTDLIKTIDEDEISFVVDDKKDKLTIKTNKITAELILPEIKFPKLDFVVKDWKPIPTGMLKGLSLCKFSACPDQTSGPLTGVHICGSDILSCDRFRVSRYKMKVAIKPSITIPVELIDQLDRYNDQLDGFSVIDDTIFFKMKKEKAILAAKLIQGEYPVEKLSKALAEDTDKWDAIKLTEELKVQIEKAVNRQNIIQNNIIEFDREMQIGYEKGSIKLFSINTSVGSLSEILSVKTDERLSGSFDFVVNPIFLLKSFTEASYIKHAQALSTCAFVSTSFIHLVKTKQKKAGG